MLDSHIKLLTKELEIEGTLATQVPGVYALPLEEDTVINITDKPPGCTLSCSLCSMPKQREEEFLSQVMLGNLMGQGTRGAVLGVNEDGNLLTLTQALDYNVEYKEFRDILEDFINTVDFWKDEAKSYR